MPTGYTAGVQDGTIKTFAEYALQCARAFGACLHQRDDPPSDKPKKAKPSRHHDDELAKARRALRDVLAMSTADRRSDWQDCERSRKKHAREQVQRNKQERERYEVMLAKSRAFIAPTSEHADFAKFLVDQLEQSIKFDCDGDYWERQLEEVPFEKWIADKIARLERDVEYHASEHEKEITRVDSQNAWLAALEKAIAEVK